MEYKYETINYKEDSVSYVKEKTDDVIESLNYNRPINISITSNYQNGSIVIINKKEIFC